MKLALSHPGRWFFPALVLLVAVSSPIPVHEPVRTALQQIDKHISLPLSFEENRGQVEQRVRFLARGGSYNLALLEDGAELKMRRVRSSGDGATATLRLRLSGANRSAGITALEPLPGRVSYYTGNDPSRWRTGVPTFAGVRYENVWRGVDLIYYGNQRQLEYDFIVAPQADPRAIRLEFGGADRLSLDEAGNLLIEVAGHQVRQHRPVIYQEADGVRREISGGYELAQNNQVSFTIAEYDHHRPLVIDPALSYATFFGGGNAELSSSIALDSAGNMYVAGVTGSSDLPGAQQGSLKGANDAFVMKLNAAGNTLLYATYFGGSVEDFATDVAVDSGGSIYFCGYTTSADLPTLNPVQAQFGGESDLFVARLDANGALLYSTYLGGSRADVSTEMAVDGAGNAVLTGYTLSSDFPLKNPFKTAFGGGTCGNSNCPDAFVVKLNAAGSALVFSSYLGGSGLELGTGLALDGSGNIYLTGMTGSTNFTVKNAQQPALAGGTCGSNPCTDAFITKVDSAGALVFSTYFGGGRGRTGGIKAGNEGERAAASASERGARLSALNTPVVKPDLFALFGTSDTAATAGLVDTEPSDLGLGIAVDAQGSIYLTGVTGSIDLPVRNAAQPTHKGGKLDAFVAKFNATATALAWCTYLGGASDDGFENTILSALGFSHQSIAVDVNGNVYVTGTTVSDDFPQVSQLPPGAGVDAFVTKFNSAGAITFSTYYGGGSDDVGAAIAVSSAGTVFLTGETMSPDLPTVSPLQAALRGEADAFIARISEGVSSAVPVTCVSAANYRGGELARESIVAAFGSELATTIAGAAALPLPTSLAGTTVKIKDSTGTDRLAPLFFVSPTQINYYVPDGTAEGTATVTVTSGSGRVSTGTVQIRSSVPGLFSANASGQGVAAALAVRVKANGTLFYEPVAQYDAAQGKFVPLPIDLGPDQGAATDVVVLALFGTGIRYRQSVSVNVGGVEVQVDYAGITPGFIGLDQVNVRLPRSLIGRGEVTVNLTIDGRNANPVTVSIR
ncbi:MAG TPA: SBBP repeat-containing protein [Blastocatellia bacterium]|nr:SBBP repeat-containing protein [Blastocatellia bacterium]